MNVLTKVGIGVGVGAAAFTAGVVTPAIGKRDGDVLESPKTTDVMATMAVGGFFGAFAALHGTNSLTKVAYGAAGVASGITLGALFGAGTVVTKSRFD